MRHPLEHQLALLRSRVRWLVTLHGLSWLLATVLATAVTLGLIDYAVRFQQRGPRLASSLLACGVLLWTCYRYVYLPARARLRDTDLALRLQRRFPDLDDRLLSAVEFLRQPAADPRSGSAALRQAVIAQTAAEAQRLDFRQAVDARPPARAAMFAAVACLLAAGLLLLDPSSAAIAVRRLLNPFSAAVFPQRTHLVLWPKVTQLHAGKPFVLTVTAAGGTRLPAEALLHYRFKDADGTVTEETDVMGRKDDAMIAQRGAMRREFDYRVTGGDDQSMPWITVKIVNPPAVQSFVVQLAPPEYTGWPVEESRELNRVLVGTRVRITAKTNKPLRSAELYLDKKPWCKGRVHDDGHSFTVPGPDEEPLTIETSGSYSFRLIDREGLAGGGDVSWELRAVPDRPPTAVLDSPTADLYVTPEATLPVRVSTGDDLALRRVALFLSRSDAAKPLERTLYAGPQQPPPAIGDWTDAAPTGDRRALEDHWALEPLGLSPGTQATFYAAAFDYRGQVGKSEVRRLTVVTPQELRDRVAGRQTLVLAELERVLKMQQGGSTQVAAVRKQLAGGKPLEPSPVNQLRAAELTQREVDRSLTSPGEGVRMHVAALLADLRNNAVDSPDVQRRMEHVMAEIERLERDHLPVINRQLTAAVKSFQAGESAAAPSPQDDPAFVRSLTEAAKSQDAVIATLQQLLGQLNQAESHRRFYRDVAQLLHDQEQLAERTVEVARTTLTRQLKELASQQLGDLAELAEGQLQFARRLDRIEQDMEQAEQGLRKSDPLAADTVGDALAESRRLGITGAMRSCGANLRENRLGQIVETEQRGLHKQIVQNLQEVLGILADRRQHELDRLLRGLQEAEKELAALAGQQSGLLKQVEQAALEADAGKRLAQLQRIAQELRLRQQEAERLGRRLERLKADRPAKSVAAAAAQMDAAAQGAGQGDLERLRKQLEAARRSVEDARRQLAADRLQAQAESLLDELARLEDAAKQLHAQQQKVLDDTLRYEALRQANGGLKRSDATGLKDDVARPQRTLQRDAARWAENLAAAGAFHLALSAAARDMGAAADLLDNRDTGAAAQQFERSALARLALLIEALKPEKKPDENDEPPPKPDGQTQRGVQSLAELKLLRLLQQQVNDRTRQLQETVVKAGSVNEEQRRQYQELAAEQERLVELVDTMITTEPDGPEEESP
jgi:hypothetical protein